MWWALIAGVAVGYFFHDKIDELVEKFKAKFSKDD